MYAIIQTGGKQVRVTPGDVIQLEILPDKKKGDAVEFNQVLLVSTAAPEGQKSETWVGAPLLKGATVQGEVFQVGRGDKIVIYKMRRRKKYRRTQGHRQSHADVLITAVKSGQGKDEVLEAGKKSEILAKSFSNLKAKGTTPKAKAAATTSETKVKSAPKAKSAPKKAKSKE